MTIKPKPAQGTDGRFITGNSGGGRPPGSRNKLSEAFIDALADDFEKHGPDVIQRVRADEPGAYLRVIASLMPKRMEAVAPSLDQLSDAELMEIAQSGEIKPNRTSAASRSKATH